MAFFKKERWLPAEPILINSNNPEYIYNYDIENLNSKRLGMVKKFFHN
jgi:hypothetical protein